MFGELLSFGAGAASFYQLYSAIAQGRKLDEILNLLKREKTPIEKLDEHLLFAPHSTPAILTAGATRPVNLRDVRELLRPVQKSLGGDILASAALLTPPKLLSEMSNDAWKCFADIRPLDKASRESRTDYVPILFWHQGVPYVGWQTIGAMRAAFDIDFSASADAWKPKHPASQQKTDRKEERSIAPSNNRIEGTVKFWNPTRKYGFITPADGSDDVFIHLGEVQKAGLKALNDGQHISFETQPDPKKKGRMAVKLSAKTT